MTLKPCLGCGELSENRRCQDCAPAPSVLRGASPLERGYDWRWRKLSERARKLQPFCTDCGAEDNLTADHLPSAWQRREQGLPLRLQDVEVVCNDCNVRRGSSRIGSERADQQPSQQQPARQRAAQGRRQGARGGGVTGA